MTAVSVRVSPLEQGVETVNPLTVANGTLTVDLAGPNTAFVVPFDTNIANVAYINAPAATVPAKRKTWSLTFVGNGVSRTASWGNASTWTGQVKHSGGTAPSISTTTGTHTTLIQWTEDGGLTVRSVKGSET